MFMPNAYRVKPTSSEARLEALIQERLQPGADRAAIDQRIWDLFGEQWAVMFTDLSGFSRQVASFGIIHFLQVIYESLRELTPMIERHDGILLKVEADSMMVIFRQPTSALAAAIEMMRRLEAYNVERSAEEQILLCVGLGFGRVLRIGDDDVFGPGKVEDGVWEAVQKDPANVPIYDGARERVLRDERDGKVKGCDEPRTEALLPQLVPRVDGLDIFRRKVAEDDGEGHFFFKSEARTAGQGRPAAGRAFRSVRRASSCRR